MRISCINCTSKKNGFFCGLDITISQKIDKEKAPKSLKKGEVLFVDGQEADGVYCIQAGKVKVVRKDPNGKDAIIRIKGQGDMVGHYHLFQSQKFIATATALEDSHVCFIDKKFLLKTVEEEPELAMRFINHLSNELKNSYLKITSLVSKNVKSRLADLLLQIGSNHGTQLHEGLRIDVKLTREEMASLIGTVNETVTRFLTEFKDCRIIEEKEKTLYILKPEKLKEIANH